MAHWQRRFVLARRFSDLTDPTMHTPTPKQKYQRTNVLLAQANRTIEQKSLTVYGSQRLVISRLVDASSAFRTETRSRPIRLRLVRVPVYRYLGNSPIITDSFYSSAR